MSRPVNILAALLMLVSCGSPPTGPDTNWGKWGAEDQIIPLECGQLYQQAIPGATLRTLDRAGHWPHYERPTELVEIISAFVARG